MTSLAAPLIRRADASDAAELGRICFEAFDTLARAHGVRPDFPSASVAVAAISALISRPGSFSVVAEIDGRIAGGNFLDERNSISGIGPVTVDPTLQNNGVGRALMEAVMERSESRGFAGVRLVHAAYHRRAVALFLKQGFEAREALACLRGPPVGHAPHGFHVRPATADDIDACNALCARVHGHHREGELVYAVTWAMAQVVERAGRITAYATDIGYIGHAVGETGEDVAALIAAAPAISGPGVLVPLRNGELMRWCLARGLRVAQPMTLMSKGLYNEPKGAWLPSVIY
jgi:predicted N-acetyltransferase YhbS